METAEDTTIAESNPWDRENEKEKRRQLSAASSPFAFPRRKRGRATSGRSAGSTSGAASAPSVAEVGVVAARRPSSSRSAAAKPASLSPRPLSLG